MPIFCTRPQTSVDAQLPPRSGLLYSSEAVSRHWLQGSSASGCSRRPTLYSAVQFRVGAIQARPDQESRAAGWMLQRFSLGSRPLKAEASSLIRSMVNPVVTTPKLVWVESCRWCANGASGSSAADARWIYVTGPRAGSAEGPPYSCQEIFSVSGNVYSADNSAKTL